MPKKRHLISKTYSKNNDPDTDVSTARGRLMGALQGIIHGSDEESEASDNPHETESTEEEETIIPDVLPDDRRKKQENVMDCTHSYIMKLYDRSVDLTMFSEDTPLYPICRAWISNEPKLKDRKSSHSEKTKTNENRPIKREPLADTDEFDGEIKDVYVLPAPVEAPINRLPSKLEIHAKSSKKSNINLDYDLDEAPSKEELLKEHQKRWQDIRTHWQKHSADNEKRYRHSCRILAAIYNKAQESMEY